MTTKQEISAWFDKGVVQNATHMIVVCDTFDYNDYPAFANGDADVRNKYVHYNCANMQRVMEVYDLRDDKEEQLSQHRVMRLPKA